MSDYSRVLKLSVISIEEGVRCGKVVDLLVDFKKFVVFGIIVKGGWNKDAEVVMFKDIESIGPDVIMVPNSKAIKPAAKAAEAMRAIKEHVDITKLQVITKGGHVMGKVQTFEFSPATGKIQQFELAGSVLKSIFEGKNVIPVNRVISVGVDAMIVAEKVKPQPKKEQKAEPKKEAKKPAAKKAAPKKAARKKKAPAKKKKK